LLIGEEIRCKQHQLQAVFETELGANDQPYSAPAIVTFCGLMGSYHAGHGAFVGNRNGYISELDRALDQLIGVRGATLEREVR
jgi:hypothetical protein